MTFVLSLTPAPHLLQLKQREGSTMTGGVRDMAEAIRKLPIGVQSFEVMRQEQFLYVDKTQACISWSKKPLSMVRSRF